MSLLLDRFLLPLASFCPILFAQIATRRRGDPRGSPKSVENFNRILGERRKKINFPWHQKFNHLQEITAPSFMILLNNIFLHILRKSSPRLFLSYHFLGLNYFIYLDARCSKGSFYDFQFMTNKICTFFFCFCCCFSFVGVQNLLTHAYCSWQNWLVEADWQPEWLTVIKSSNLLLFSLCFYYSRHRQNIDFYFSRPTELV